VRTKDCIESNNNKQEELNNLDASVTADTTDECVNDKIELIYGFLLYNENKVVENNNSLRYIISTGYSKVYQ
jgi:hypothetical protein